VDKQVTLKMSSDEVVMLKFDKSSKNTASEDNSPDVKTKTHLVIADKDLKKLEVQVKDQIRRASYRV
jgi:hypothetical protein